MLAWELGANRGHVTPLAAIVRHLLAHGVRVTLAVQRLDALRSMRPIPDGVAIVQAPIWPALLVTAGFKAERAPASFGDILADLGLRDSGVVEFMVRAWDGLFASLDPDVVVAEFAPMAMLAARGRIPVVAMGTGFSLPPCETDVFPRLRNVEPHYVEGRIVEAVNLGLARTKRPPLERLPQIMAADLRRPYSFAIFDPYQAHRKEPLLAPILPAWSPARSGAGTEVFVYFSDIVGRPEPLFDAVACLGSRGRFFMPNLPEPNARMLVAAGVNVESRPRTSTQIAQHSRLVVSHGGQGFVSMTLAAGLPQLVLAPDLEKRLVGTAVARLGVGRLMAWRDASADRIGEAIAALEDDEATRDRALEAGAALTPLLAQDTAEQIAKDVLSFCRSALST